MQIPVVKTLLKYRILKYGNFEYKKVLCDFIAKGSDKYAGIHYEHQVHHRNPYDFGGYSEIHSYDQDGWYAITFYDENMNVFRKVECEATHVLEFNGMIFELKETEYDFKEHDDY